MPACRDCRQNQLDSACCRGALRRRPARRRRGAPDGGGEEDRISALPDDLLLQILARLRCARAAAHAGLLARRWRGLWARLPGLTFHNTAPGELPAALALAAGPLAYLVVVVPTHGSHCKVASACVSELLRAAAGLAPARFVFCIWTELATSAEPVELPCFDRATSIELDVLRGRFMLPPAGEFSILESLSIDCCDIDPSDLLPRCPRLRKLQFRNRGRGSITVHSQSLEELEVHAFERLRSVDIVAPMLKKLRLDANSSIKNEFSLSLSALALEEFSRRCSCGSSTDRFVAQWYLERG